MSNRSRYFPTTRARPQKKGKGKRWLQEFCDDIQGQRRAAIIAEHLRWLEVVASEKVEMDFSDAPIAKAFGRRRR